MKTTTRAKQLRFTQWMMMAATVLVAMAIFVSFRDIDAAPIISAVLIVLGIGQFFFFGDQAEKMEHGE